MTPLGRPLTIREAAERAGVYKSTIYRWMEAGKVRVLVTASGSKRIEEASLWRPTEQDYHDVSE